MEKQVKNLRTLSGTVVSTAMSKTAVVLVDRVKEVKKYHKGRTVSRKYHVHDEKGLSKPGNVVKFVECRPLSKTKRWRLSEVVK